MTAALPKLALSIMQPWAWLIVNGHKDIENRDWPTKFRGPVAIHAGKKVDTSASISVDRGFHPVTGAKWLIDVGAEPATDLIPFAKGGDYFDQLGGILGMAEIVDCVSASESEWFVGRHGFVIRNARPVEFIPVRGALGFFDWRRNLK